MDCASFRRPRLCVCVCVCFVTRIPSTEACAALGKGSLGSRNGNRIAFTMDSLAALTEVAKVGGRACTVIRDSGCLPVLCALLNCTSVDVLGAAAQVLSFCTMSGPRDAGFSVVIHHMTADDDCSATHGHSLFYRFLLATVVLRLWHHPT